MRPLRFTDALKASAVNCVWFESPEHAISVPARFVAYVLTFGTSDDVAALREQLTDDDLREALDNAPPGIFDARSWAYWNLIVGREEAPPMPTRRFE
jgi:hypothetical protein